LTWCMRFPDAEQFGDDAVIEEQDPSDPEDVRYRIQGITPNHRMVVAFVVIVRGVMAAVLAYVGGNFLLKQTDYLDLLLDGVALIFIVQIQQVLYAQVLRDEIRDQCEDSFRMKVEMYGVDYLNRRPALVDMISLAALVVMVYMIEQWHVNSIVRPIHDALECTCLSSGQNCYEAQKFGYDFWHQYWKSVVPDVFTAIAALKSGAPAAGAASLMAKTQRVAPKAMHMNDVHNLYHHHQTHSRLSSWLHHFNFRSFLG